MATKRDPDLEVIIKQVHMLLMHWSTFKTIWMHSDRRVTALSSKMPTLMATFKESVYNDVVIRISRLTDPPGTPGRENLVLERLVNDPRASARTKAKMKRLQQLMKRVRAHRNKAIAHLDHAVGHNLAIIPPYRLQSVEKIVRTIQTVVVYLFGDFYKSGSGFVSPTPAFECGWLEACLELGAADKMATGKRAMELAKPVVSK